jgi:hypothetical protein
MVLCYSKLLPTVSCSPTPPHSPAPPMPLHRRLRLAINPSLCCHDTHQIRDISFQSGRDSARLGCGCIPCLSHQYVSKLGVTQGRDGDISNQSADGAFDSLFCFSWGRAEAYFSQLLFHLLSLPFSSFFPHNSTSSRVRHFTIHITSNLNHIYKMPIAHISIPVSSLPASTAFYLSALAPLDYSTYLQLENTAGFNAKYDGPDLWLSKCPESTYSAEKQKVHVAFKGKSKKAVKEFYQAALCV